MALSVSHVERSGTRYWLHVRGGKVRVMYVERRMTLVAMASSVAPFAFRCAGEWGGP